MTPASVIAEARVLVQDNDSTLYRNSDASLVIMVNRALKRIASLRPDLFTATSAVALVAGVTQTAPNYGRVIEVFGVTSGIALTETTRELSDRNTPTWRSMTSVAAASLLNWMRHSRNPSKFFVVPPSNGTGTVDVEYTAPPATYALNDTIAMLGTYEPAVTDMTVAEIEWADDENVLNQRAEAFYKRAKDVFMGELQTRALTDTEKSGIPGALD